MTLQILYKLIKLKRHAFFFNFNLDVLNMQLCLFSFFSLEI